MARCGDPGTTRSGKRTTSPRARVTLDGAVVQATHGPSIRSSETVSVDEVDEVGGEPLLNENAMKMFGVKWSALHLRRGKMRPSTRADR